MTLRGMINVILRMRSRERLESLKEAIADRIHELEFLERRRRRQELVRKDPRHALDEDHRDHPRWDKERERKGWPGPGWVWGRRGWRKLGEYDG
jgi:hypothetical protein